MEQNYHIKAKITNISDKALLSGYRPAHDINGYMTTGVHKYTGCDKLGAGKSAIGYITFIMPELYLDSIKTGDIIDFYDGSKKTGFAFVIEVYNEQY